MFQTKRDFVYERLRAEIVSGTLKPGKRLILREIALMMGTSLLPVREAIQKLEAEGFVISSPHVGARIAFPDFERIKETLLIRASLESLAICETASHMTSRDYEDFDKIIQEAKKAHEKQDAMQCSRLNREFHLRLFESCPLPRLKKMIQDLWDESSLSSNLMQFMPQRSKQNLKEHRDIVRSLRKGDVERAEALLSIQRERALKALRKHFEMNEGKKASG